ncbi:MAG TPA: YciI family protein [Kofleriaceae bacterium]
MMHKVTPELEAGTPPRPGLVQEMGALVGGLVKSGKMLAGAGLRPSAERVRLTFEGGGPVVKHGPYEGSNELLASCALIRTTTMDQAIAIATRIAAATGDRELEVGAVTEPWHLGVMEKPANAPLQCLVLRKADAAFERSGAQPAALAGVLDELRREGVLVMSVALAPSATGKRSQVAGGKRQWTDGPFAESKELISGFCVIELDSIEEAQALTEQYGAILGDNEIDLRGVTDVAVERG